VPSQNPRKFSKYRCTAFSLNLVHTVPKKYFYQVHSTSQCDHQTVFYILFLNPCLPLPFPYVHVHMPRRLSNLSLLSRWLPDAPLVFAKASECTKLLDLLPPYACDAAIIRPESGFLKAILQNDFVCFKYLLGTAGSGRTPGVRCQLVGGVITIPKMIAWT